MNHCAPLFHLLSVLLSAYLLLCLCIIILNTSSAEQHRRHHSHHTALHRHHPHHRSRNNHYHHHLIISSRSDQKQQEDDNEGWQEARTHRRNRTPRPPSPKPVVLNNQFQRITPPPPSHSGQPRPPRPYTQGPPPPRPGRRGPRCGDNAEWVDNCDTAKAAFQQGSENGNGCFSTTCTSYLESGGLQRGSYRTYGCFCRPKHFWVDGPGEAEPFKPTARCALAARCPAVERHLATTPMWLHLTWTKGLAHYRTWVAGKQAAGVWRPNTAAGDIQSYVNETAVAATTRWLVHFLALHEGDRFAPAHVNPEPRWHLLKKEVHERLLAQYGDQWARAFMQEHPASLGRQTAADGSNIEPDLLFYAWKKHGNAFGINFPPEAYFALVDRLYREVNLDGRLMDAGVTPSDDKSYPVKQFLEAVSTGKNARKYHFIPEESIRLIFRPMIIEVVICFANVAGKAYIACPNGGSVLNAGDELKYFATF